MGQTRHGPNPDCFLLRCVTVGESQLRGVPSWGACRPGRVLQPVLTSSLPLVCGWHDAPCPSARTPLWALPHGAPSGAPCTGPVDSPWPGKCSSLPGQVGATRPQATLTAQERDRVARELLPRGRPREPGRVWTAACTWYSTMNPKRLKPTGQAHPLASDPVSVAAPSQPAHALSPALPAACVSTSLLPLQHIRL